MLQWRRKNPYKRSPSFLSDARVGKIDFSSVPIPSDNRNPPLDDHIWSCIFTVKSQLKPFNIGVTSKKKTTTHCSIVRNFEKRVLFRRFCRYFPHIFADVTKMLFFYFRIADVNPIPLKQIFLEYLMSSKCCHQCQQSQVQHKAGSLMNEMCVSVLCGLKIG